VNSSITINGMVRPGNTASSYIGTLYFGNKDVTFASGSVLQLTVRQCASSSYSGGTSIDNVNTLTINGTLRVNLASNHTLQAGDSIRLWKANKLAGTPTIELPDGIEWDIDRLSEGLLFVKSVSDGIVPLRYVRSESNDIYDLNGRLVRKDATTTEGLPSGIYVRRGRKIVVR
ncbi:MAG: hypothetical protein J6Y97_07025, partial [Prevotella sp.]|nr:hypothetical protein [Prevotella sp.]